MTPLRTVLFWIHLTAGTIAGTVILIMSVTGLLLTYERQVIAWADRSGVGPASAGAARLPVGTLLARLVESQAAVPDSLTVRADPAAPVEAAFGRERVLLVDGATGAVRGEGARGVRTFLRGVTDWHRWLGTSGPGRTTGRAITGACNLAFLFLVVSGIFLWLPRQWSWRHVRPALLFRGGLSGRARDWNWHNVIGIWMAVPLFFVVISATVISYPWASNLVYQLVGSPVPPPAGPPPGARPAGGGGAATVDVDGLDRAWSRAERQVPGWESITLRLPVPPGRPVTFGIDQSHRGRPDQRSQLTVDGRTGAVVKHETFAEYNRGRQIRTWLRWIHTGEAGGLVGQTIAGLATAGGTVLVWTGLALTWRRFRAWRTPRRVVEQRVA